jgi:ketosteroid isomerase-like protein
MTVILICFQMGSDATTAQEKTNEKIIREITTLEEAEVKAVLASDTTALKNIWSEDLHVNSPTNDVVDRRQVLQRMANTFIQYSTFTRDQEYIGIHGDVVIVMGRETVVPSGNRPEKGQSINRRYTNIYKMQEGKWRLVGRHASLIIAK